MTLKTYKTIQFSYYFGGEALRAPLYSSARNGSSPQEKPRAVLRGVRGDDALRVVLRGARGDALQPDNPVKRAGPQYNAEGQISEPIPPIDDVKEF